ncbi:MAG: CSLREA domain-containing protein [Bacteroidetes bacterium]|nr:CSLREA domain-containing protein [Bacteroidota bacterium]
MEVDANKKQSVTNEFLFNYKNVFVVFFLFIVFCALPCAVTAQTTYTVNTTTDENDGSCADGDCSLRDAIILANGSNGNTIIFDLGAGIPHTINLNLGSALPAITCNSLTINGWENGANDGTPNSVSVFSASTVTPINPSYAVIITNTTVSSISGFSVTGNYNEIKGLVIKDIGIPFTSGTNRAITLAGNNNKVLGCYLGITTDGVTTTSVTSRGVYITGANNTIGDGSEGGLNLISGAKITTSVCCTFYATAGGFGIEISGASATGNIVKGNLIGTLADGTTGSSQGTGINITTSNYGNIIGGTGSKDGNVISGNSNGIQLNSVYSNTIIGNRIGVAANGVEKTSSNQDGVLISASYNNVVGGTSSAHRNILSGNSGYGVRITGAASTGNRIMGNYIGTASDGSSFIASSSQDFGVHITSSATLNTIGGTATGEGNVISGNTTGSTSGGTGVYINGVSSNTVVGNIIGPDRTGAAIINTTVQPYGVYLANNSTNNIIGNTLSSGRNIISGNSIYGIYATGSGCSANTIKGNYIGLASDGASYITSSEQDYGIYFASSANANTIGGTGTEEGNVISANYEPANIGYGIYFDTAPTNTVVGNTIGMRVNGTSLVTGTVQGNGIVVSNSANNQIGGTATGARNILSGNTYSGVAIQGSSSTGNKIQGNYIGLQSSGSAQIAGHMQDHGIYLLSSSSRNIIGGYATGEGNVISGNAAGGTAGGNGIYMNSVSSNTVVGNIIGTMKDGYTICGLQTYGVSLDDSWNNVIGGTTAIARNIISSHGAAGVFIFDPSSSGNVVIGNYLGLASDGSTYITSSDQNYGVYLASGANFNIVGGAAAGEGNVISGQYSSSTTEYGVYLDAAVTNTVVGNIIGLQKDGYTRVGGTPATQGTGVYLSNGSIGNVIGGSTSAHRNIISDNTDHGIYITGSTSTGNKIQGNYIGIASDGTYIASNTQEQGVYFASSTSFNTIGGALSGEGNVISGNGNASSAGNGIYFTAAYSNTVQGNIIGLRPNGASLSSGQDYGIILTTASSGNVLGGSSSTARNIISGNGVSGVHLIYSANNNRVQGNYLGTASDGSYIATNGQNFGVTLANDAYSNTIGGTASGEGNLISGLYAVSPSTSYGVHLNSAHTNTVIGNIIGLGKDGTTRLNPGSNYQTSGVYIENGSRTNVIGGDGSVNQRNIISDNETYGVYLTGSTSTGNTIKGNYIGLASDGATFVSSSSQNHGIYLASSASKNTIGGTVAGEGNIISGNSDGATSGNGIYLDAALTNTVLGNTIGLQSNGSSLVTSSTQQYGVYIANNSTGNSIGSNVASGRNVISGNTESGIYLTGANCSSNTIRSNIIGLAADGFTYIASQPQDYGIRYTGGARSNSGIYSAVVGIIAGHNTNIYNDNGASNGISSTYIGLKSDGSTSVTETTQTYGVYATGATSGYSLSDCVISGQQYNIYFDQAEGFVNGCKIGTNAVGTGTVSGVASQSVGIYFNNTPPQVYQSVVSSNNGTGIYVTGSEATGGSIYFGNFIGLNATGTSVVGSQTNGIVLTNSVSGVTIGGYDYVNTGEGNIISGNGTGISILNSSSGNTVKGNFIGLQADGVSAITSTVQSVGILIDAPNNYIGEAGDPLYSNFIVGNYSRGINITSGGSGTVIKNNYIGVAFDGATTYSVSNSSVVAGIGVSANDITIGGDYSALEGNVISGNECAGTSYGIFIGTTSNTTIKGNIIGLAANGTSLVSPSQNSGIGIFGPSALGVTIGGGTSNDRNILSGNTARGIRISGSSGGSYNKYIYGNYIGPDINGANIGGSSQDIGISIGNTNAGIVIGSNSGAGTSRPKGNLIAYNTTNGITITGAASTGILISRNLIYSNGGNGISLASSANASKAKPTVTAFTGTSASGTATAADTVEVFKNTTGQCQDAMTYLGSVLADGSGNWSITGVTINNGESVTATARTVSDLNTSELASTCMVGLPIELLSFSAENINNEYTQLKWITASETNNDYFTIEKTQDGINYEFVAKVAGAGNSAQVLNYTTNDFKPYQGVSYYRLKQTDFDGAYDYSELVSVEFQSLKLESSMLVVYPNPATNSNMNVLFNGQSGEEVLIVVHDVLGKEFYSKAFILEEEQLIANIETTQNLAPGLYTITASSNNKFFNKKVIVK